MNDLSFGSIPLNQRDLEHVEQGESLSAKIDAVDTADKVVQFYIYLFAEMEERTLTVKTNCIKSTFGLILARDPQYSQAYIVDINKKSSVVCHSSSHKVTCKATQLSCLVGITGHHI